MRKTHRGGGGSPGRRMTTVAQSRSRQGSGRSPHGEKRVTLSSPKPRKAILLPPGQSPHYSPVYLISNPCHSITNRTNQDGVGTCPLPAIYTSPRA